MVELSVIAALEEALYNNRWRDDVETNQSPRFYELSTSTDDMT